MFIGRSHSLSVTSGIVVFGVILISALAFASFSKISVSNSFVNNDQFSPVALYYENMLSSMFYLVVGYDP